MSEETQTTPESVQEGGKGGLGARNRPRTRQDGSGALRAARTFQPGDRVRVARGATYHVAGRDLPSDAAGQDATVGSGPDHDGDYAMDDGAVASARFLTLITDDPDQTPDLPVIAREDVKPGMVVEERRHLVRQEDSTPWFRPRSGWLPEYRLVSLPEPDPDAELAEQVASLMSVSIEDGMTGIEVARDLIALVDEHRAGGSDG